MELQAQLKEACWVAKQLFDRKMGPGTTGNLSFLFENKIYITGGGTCMGKLSPKDFACVDLDSLSYEGLKPSKELPLHRIIYTNKPEAKAVIHVHSTYATLWSCLHHEDSSNCIPKYTPYLEMKLGRVGLVDYAEPGSETLFANFEKMAKVSDGWILRHHGPIIGAPTLMDAFACTEELEESCRIAWELKDRDVPTV